MKLQAARKQSGKTQEQVAKEAKVGVRLYQQYEYDKSTPNVRTAIRIARAVGCAVEDVFYDSAKP